MRLNFTPSAPRPIVRPSNRTDIACGARTSAWRSNMLSRIPSVAGLVAAALVATTPALAQKGPLQKIGKGEGRVDIVAWAGYIERGATDKNFDWVTDFEKKTRLQGQRQDRRHLRRDGGADERGRLRPRHRLGRREHAADPRQEGAADQRRPDAELQEHRPAAAEGALALREQHPLRRAVPVGLERADVQHPGLQGQAAHQLERGVRGDRRCPTARATRAACRPSTGRSTSPTPRCT